MGFGAGVSELRAQRYLAQSSEYVNRVFERLSSGQRINRASDDAAGLAIADGLRANSRVYSAAIRNVNDGISSLQITDNTLQQQSDIVGRLIELAEQSANGTFSSAQRKTLSAEYRQLVYESGRLAASATFNGTSLLDSAHFGGPTTLSLQAGITGDRNSLLSLAQPNTGANSGTIYLGSALAGWDAADGFLDFNDFLDFLSDSASDDPKLKTYIPIEFRDTNGVARTLHLTVADLSTSGNVTEVAFVVSAENQLGLPTITPTSINGFSDFAVSMFFDKLTGQALSSNAGTGTLGPPVIDPQSTLSVIFGGAGFSGDIGIDFSALKVFAGPGETTAASFTDIRTVQGARRSLDILRARLGELSTIRGNVGAVQSRLQAALNVNLTQRENSQAAESRLRDVDVATEGANLVRSQILQQMATQVLGQIRLQSSISLDLLR